MANMAIIIQNAQNDFLTGRPAGVYHSEYVFDKIANYISEYGDCYDLIVTTQKWHIDKENCFKNSTVHCVAGTKGAELYSPLVKVVEPLGNYRKIFQGKFRPSFSAFEGEDRYGNSLVNILTEENIKNIQITGTPVDYDILNTAVDAVDFGFNVDFIEDLSIGRDCKATEIAIEDMERKGVVVDRSF